MIPLPRPRFTLRQIMVVIANSGVVFGLLVLAYREGNHRGFEMSVLLGPILFIQDVATENQAWGIGLSLLLAPCILTGIVRPRPWSIVLGVFAALAWLFLGVLGWGIDC